MYIVTVFLTIVYKSLDFLILPINMPLTKFRPFESYVFYGSLKISNHKASL